MSAPRPIPSFREQPISRLIFMSRWLQLPLYMGLIIAQGVYVYYFWVELVHLVEAAFGHKEALESILKNVTPPGANLVPPPETVVMLVVLGLIDVVMISNLLIMVIVGGYETFVSRMNLDDHPDQPEWLSHVNASVLKVKLATAIIGISSIHLLKTFINAAAYEEKTLFYQTVIHVAFLFSALAIAAVDRVMPPPVRHSSTPASH
jgi:uncharacterized protein (TIGR00645 family)